ncbi:hypothetical protein HYDPIDRAFT_32927 [Hydnomerulius pinastri MD-312]|uniref:Conserved oligomeric Golgi complex subunit 6 n=1 Tax=Hydnomerulius pinastri MD-312 TaxID=994086 RepID=A0A0C9W952_9AGAM|nr:hypothetical protein HYDPIDRAFT_32927 [Hydnomerulius pinastri MD-312]
MSFRVSSPSPSISTRNASTQPSASSSSRNPITLRLRKILGTNFTDQATTEALQTLSELYSGGGATHSALTGNPPREQDPRVKDDDEDDDDWSDLDSPKAPTTSQNDVSANDPPDAPNETASRARKNLQRDLETKLAQGSHHFLHAFEKVDQKLDELERLVNDMRACCEEAEGQLKATEESSRSLLDQAEGLRLERQEVETRKSIVLLFLDRFTLSDAEVEAITSRDVSLGSRFFNAMDKTERIRSDCRVLMAGEEGPTKAGMDIMSTTSSYLEQGYEKIHRWCAFEFRRVGREETTSLEVSPTMREAVRRLAQRPDLLSDALTLLSQSRQTTLLNLFLTALTRGGPSGLPRPIELHAHDPLRYIGDMLAWVHQGIAAEYEFLESLFGLGGTAHGRMVGEARTFGGSEEEGWVGELLDEVVGKLCVPLKVRVMQTVRSQERSITSYKIAGLLQYYTLTMQRTIGARSLLSQTLQEITSASYKSFFDSIEAQGRALLRIPLDPADPSLSPPPSILDHAQRLREILQVYESSLDGSARGEPGTTADIDRILDIMVDPMVAAVGAGAEEKARVRLGWDGAVFVLNCLCYLESVLEPFVFTHEKRDAVRGVIEERVVSLSDEHTETVLRESGLYDAIHTLETKDPATPLSRLPATSPAALPTTLATFASYLSLPTPLSPPRLASLPPALATRVNRTALKRLVRGYGRLVEGVRGESERGRWEGPGGSLVFGGWRPFGRVGVLEQVLGVEGGEDEDEEESEEDDDDDDDDEDEDEEEEEGEEGQGGEEEESDEEEGEDGEEEESEADASSSS